jgi:hypothetical protein
VFDWKKRAEYAADPSVGTLSEGKFGKEKKNVNV